MKCIYTMATDVGLAKTVNQDSLCIMKADSPIGEILLAVIADGMGGLASGELASKAVVESFIAWFENDLPKLINKLDNSNIIRESWTRLIKMQNELIANYAYHKHVKMGTTVTAILLVDDRYFGIHVGDCRMYKIDKKAHKYTTDQTVVERDLSNGLITVEQAAVDNRRHILLQCVGASKIVIPLFWEGVIEQGEVLLLCCDGFWHRITDEELRQIFNPFKLTDETVMKNSIQQVIELVKNRNERDNISAILLKVE